MLFLKILKDYASKELSRKRCRYPSILSASCFAALSQPTDRLSTRFTIRNLSQRFLVLSIRATLGTATLARSKRDLFRRFVERTTICKMHFSSSSRKILPFVTEGTRTNCLCKVLHDRIRRLWLLCLEDSGDRRATGPATRSIRMVYDRSMEGTRWRKVLDFARAST